MGDTPISLDCVPTPTGILYCLRMLMTEAATLDMHRTIAALRDAIEACEAERRPLARH